MKSKRGDPWPPLTPEKLGERETPWTMPIPEFARKYYGLGRSGAYAAAKRREIPVMRVGGKLMGLPRVAEAQLSGQPAVMPPAGTPRSEIGRVGPAVSGSRPRTSTPLTSEK
jgi:hypothetical protein